MPREIHAFKNYDDCAHAFCVGQTTWGYTPGRRMSFDEDLMFSYGHHYQLMRLDRDKRIAYLNSNRYSATTARQIKEAARAARAAGFAVVSCEHNTLGNDGAISLCRSRLDNAMEKVLNTRIRDFNRFAGRAVEVAIDLTGLGSEPRRWNVDQKWIMRTVRRIMAGEADPALVRQVSDLLLILPEGVGIGHPLTLDAKEAVA